MLLKKLYPIQLKNPAKTVSCASECLYNTFIGAVVVSTVLLILICKCLSTNSL